MAGSVAKDLEGNSHGIMKVKVLTYTWRNEVRPRRIISVSTEIRKEHFPSTTGSVNA
jgi:hypothetical protein